MRVFGISWDFLGFLGISWDFLTLLGQSPDFLTLSAAAREPLVDGKHRRRCAEVSAAHAEVSVPLSGCGSCLATTGVGCACTAVQKKAGRFDACVAGLGAPRARPAGRAGVLATRVPARGGGSPLPCGHACLAAASATNIPKPGLRGTTPSLRSDSVVLR